MACDENALTTARFQPEGLTHISPGQARLRAPPRVLIKKIENRPERAREASPSKCFIKTEGGQWETLVAQASGVRECVASAMAAIRKFPNSAHRLICGEIPAD